MKYGDIYVCCSGSLMKFNNREIAKRFFIDCMVNSEGSERDRYTDIFLELNETSHRFLTDFLMEVNESKIDFNNIDSVELEKIKNFYCLGDNHIMKLMAKNEIGKYSTEIRNYDLKKNDFDFAKYYLSLDSNSKNNSFFIINCDKNNITCFDVYGDSEYFCEDFDLKDYKMASKWLNREIEYEDYLEYKSKEEDICL